LSGLTEETTMYLCITERLIVRLCPLTIYNISGLQFLLKKTTKNVTSKHWPYRKVSHVCLSHLTVSAPYVNIM